MVGIATCCRMDGPGFDRHWGWETFSSPKSVQAGQHTCRPIRIKIILGISSTQNRKSMNFGLRFLDYDTLLSYRWSSGFRRTHYLHLQFASQTLPVNLALRLHLRACALPGLVHSSHRVLWGLQQFTWQLAQALGILCLCLRPTTTTKAVQQTLVVRWLMFLKNPTKSKTARG